MRFDSRSDDPVTGEGAAEVRLADIQELEQELLTIERKALESRSAAEEHERALAELDARRADHADQLRLAEREALERRAELERKRQALEEARREELLGRVREASRRRQLATRKASAAITGVHAALDDLQDSRAGLEALLAEAADLDLASELPAETAELPAAIERLTERLRDLPPQAPGDPSALPSVDGSVGNPLPEHLREAARRRTRQGRHSFPGH